MLGKHVIDDYHCVDDVDGEVTCEHDDDLLPTVAQVCQQVAWRRKEHIVNITWRDENEEDEDEDYDEF